MLYSISVEQTPADKGTKAVPNLKKKSSGPPSSDDITMERPLERVLPDVPPQPNLDAEPSQVVNVLIKINILY